MSIPPPPSSSPFCSGLPWLILRKRRYQRKVEALREDHAERLDELDISVESVSLSNEQIVVEGNVHNPTPQSGKAAIRVYYLSDGTVVYHQLVMVSDLEPGARKSFDTRLSTFDIEYKSPPDVQELAEIDDVFVEKCLDSIP